MLKASSRDFVINPVFNMVKVKKRAWKKSKQNNIAHWINYKLKQVGFKS